MCEINIFSTFKIMSCFQQTLAKPSADAAKADRFTYVDELPSDAIKISNYGKHELKDMYFSPSEKKFYRKLKTKIRVCKLTQNGGITARTTGNKSIRIAYRKYMRAHDPDAYAKVKPAKKRTYRKKTKTETKDEIEDETPATNTEDL